MSRLHDYLTGKVKEEKLKKVRIDEDKKMGLLFEALRRNKRI